MRTIHKRTICLFFQVHQPFRLKVYRFFNIGIDHDYYDDAKNKHIIKRVAHNCYMPANDLLLSCIKKFGSAFKITFGISGTAIEQFKKFTPWVIESFRKLYETGNAEFVAESYPYSLAMLSQPAEYKQQVNAHKKILENLFGCKPKSLVFTNLAYSNGIAGIGQEMGFKTILTEGTRQVLDWRSPDYVYSSGPYPDIKLLLRNCQLSDDFSFRFSERNWSEWPLTAEKYNSWLDGLDKNEEIVNLAMDYATLGEYQNSNTGIFNFFNAFLEQTISSNKWTFRTISEAAKTTESKGTITVPEVVSWADEERDLTAWLGNEMQQEAFNTLYSVAPIMKYCTDKELLSDWNKLQTCDHFYYMSTKYQDGAYTHQFFSSYNSPYDAFVNYMNVLSDFLIRVDDYATHKTLQGLPGQVQKQEEEKQQEKYHLVTM
jgi:alpha-amylase